MKKCAVHCACYRKYFLLRLMSTLINWSASSQRNSRQMCSHGKLHWDESWVPAHDNNGQNGATSEQTNKTKKNRNGFRWILKSGNVTAAAATAIAPFKSVACINKFRIAYPQFARQYALCTHEDSVFRSFPVSLCLSDSDPRRSPGTIDTPTTFVWMCVCVFFSTIFIYLERFLRNALIAFSVGVSANVNGKQSIHMGSTLVSREKWYTVRSIDIVLLFRPMLIHG